MLKNKFNIKNSALLIIVISIIGLKMMNNNIIFNARANEKVFFSTQKTFTAPKSKIKIEVKTSGYFIDNNDFGSGTSNVKLFGYPSKTDTLQLRTSPENIDSIIHKNTKIVFNCGSMQKNELYKYLISIGYKNLDKNEISELRDAMTFINYGPKAGFVKGQTKFIEVEN